jgi:hypothetical protein
MYQSRIVWSASDLLLGGRNGKSVGMKCSHAASDASGNAVRAKLTLEVMQQLQWQQSQVLREAELVK